MLSVFSASRSPGDIRLSNCTEELSRLIREKNIENLYHFTDMNNLKGIFDSQGLLSRMTLKRNGLLKQVLDSASGEIIKRRETVKLFNGRNLSEYVPLYFSRRSPMLYVTEGLKDKEDKYPHTPRPVYFLFNPSIILREGVILADGNASAENTTISQGPASLKAVDMDAVRTPVSSIKHKFNNSVYREFKRKKQAEVLVPARLDINFLNSICFRSEAEKKEAERILGDCLKKYPYRVVPELFHCHRPYVKDFNLNKDLNLEVTLANKNISFTALLRISSERGIQELKPQHCSSERCTYNSGNIIRASKNIRMDYFLNGYNMFSINFVNTR